MNDHPMPEKNDSQTKPGNHAEASAPESSPRPRKEKRRGFKHGDAFGGVIGGLITLWLANSLEGWGFVILTDRWGELLRVINLTVTVTIITWAVLFFIHPRPLYFLGRLLVDTMSIWGIWVTIRVFPFDFSVWPNWDWLDIVVRILLWIGLVGTIIAILVRTAKFAGRERPTY